MSVEGDARQEHVDLVDPATGVPTGEVVPRSVAHRDGLWHATFHLWVVRPGEPHRVLLQKRGTGCRVAPGLFDVTVGGHLQAGETPEMGVREAEEEVGLVVDFADLVPLGVRATEWLLPDHVDREVVHLFLHAAAGGLEDVHPDPRELAGLFELDLDAAIDVLRGAAATCRASGVEWIGGRLEPRTYDVSRDAFVVSSCGYPLPALEDIRDRLSA